MLTPLAARNAINGPLAAAAFAVGGGATVYLHDTCSGSVASISGRTPDTIQLNSNVWGIDIYGAGTRIIQTDGAGKFESPSGTFTPYGTYDLETDTYTLTLGITLGVITAVCPRYADINNHFECAIRNNRLEIRERTAGPATVRATTLGTFVDGTRYECQLVLTPTSMEFTVDSTVCSYASTSKNSNTEFAIAPLNTSTLHKWDSIKAVA
jgi:hypothetical protein